MSDFPCVFEQRENENRNPVILIGQTCLDIYRVLQKTNSILNNPMYWWAVHLTGSSSFQDQINQQWIITKRGRNTNKWQQNSPTLLFQSNFSTSYILKRASPLKNCCLGEKEKKIIHSINTYQALNYEVLGLGTVLGGQVKMQSLTDSDSGAIQRSFLGLCLIHHL